MEYNTTVHDWYKNVLNLVIHFMIDKILYKVKKQEICILISYTNSNKEHTNRDTTIPNSDENIKIGDKTVYNKSCFENGIKFINDLTNNDGSIYTYDELKTIYNVTINVLQYSGLVRPILAWKKPLNLANIRHNEANPFIPIQSKYI